MLCFLDLSTRDPGFLPLAQFLTLQIHTASSFQKDFPAPTWDSLHEESTSETVIDPFPPRWASPGHTVLGHVTLVFPSFPFPKNYTQIFPVPVYSPSCEKLGSFIECCRKYWSVPWAGLVLRKSDSFHVCTHWVLRKHVKKSLTCYRNHRKRSCGKDPILQWLIRIQFTRTQDPATGKNQG